MTIENKELTEKASKLGIEIKDDMSEDDLNSAISTKEKEIQEKENDIDHWKEQAKKWEEEAKKAFESRDTAKKERRALQTKITDLENKISDSPDADDVEALRSELESLKEMKEEFEKKKEEEALKGKTDLEKQQLHFNKEIENLRKEMAKRDEDLKKKDEAHKKELEIKEKEIFSQRRFRLDGEIKDIAIDHKAYNPNQIVRMLKDEFEYNADLDKFEIYTYDSKGKPLESKSVKERVEEFLTDPKNDNLIQSDINTSGTGTRHSDTTTIKDDDYKKKLDREEKENLKAEAEEAGVTVERLLEIRKVRDEAFKKAKEARMK